MENFKLTYTGSEAVEIIKNYYPNDWVNKLEVHKRKLIKLAAVHNISLEKAYSKFIVPVAGTQESIIFFAALSELLKLQKMQPKEKSERIIELENKKETIKNQIIALEYNTTAINYEDKKMLSGYYTRLQQETTTEINELLRSFEVVEPQLIIHQPGLFDAGING